MRYKVSFEIDMPETNIQIVYNYVQQDIDESFVLSAGERLVHILNIYKSTIKVEREKGDE